MILGVQGRILGVLAETTAELNLRTVARLADVSAAQASRVLPELVELGLVERREVPPSAPFRLVREHVAATCVLALASVRERLIIEMGRIADNLPVVPASVIIFGAFARKEADQSSDIDTVLVRPGDVDESDEGWAASVDSWRELVGRASGSRVEVLEVAEDVIERRLRSGRGVWREIRQDGIVVAGSRPGELDLAHV